MLRVPRLLSFPFQCRTRLCGWCNTCSKLELVSPLKFQCRTRLCGWCNDSTNWKPEIVNIVSMPHAALWVVQPSGKENVPCCHVPQRISFTCQRMAVAFRTFRRVSSRESSSAEAGMSTVSTALFPAQMQRIFCFFSSLMSHPPRTVRSHIPAGSARCPPQSFVPA